MVGYHLIISNKSKLWITFVISLFFLMKNENGLTGDISNLLHT
jgi:hypothetical protein